ncbi:MAG: DUF1330 domain-containing protein [Hyphomicrobiales bacterium]|jgi:uncharacterized protein (DUF1330 family)|nr:MAG: DUF1330 domain-containing protein [Hyphomicrobiales bacterium]
MPKKGYWIAHVEVTNPERYKDYVAANGVAFAKYGARFIVRGGTAVDGKTGTPSRQRHVVIEFDSLETAKACLASPEYQAAAKIRDEASTATLIVVEGWDG